MPYEGLDAKIDALALKKLNELTERGVQIFREEMPRRTGNMRQKTSATLAKKMPNGTFQSEIVIDTDYARAVDLGIDENANQIQKAKNKYMVFSDWPNGPDSLRWSDGNFRFTRVRHIVPANHFSQRALKRIRAIARTSLYNKLNISIRQLLGTK